jgi:peptide deformylase
LTVFPHLQQEILTIGDPRLRQPAEPVEPGEVAAADTQELIDALVATMRAAQGAGLAATQIGVAKRVCVIEVDDNPRYPYKPKIPLTVIVNPRLTLLSAERFLNNEGCLSVPGFRGDVHRCTEIRVDGLDRSGDPLDFTVRGLSAGTFQHECDHLDGLLFTDRLADPASLTTWDNFTRYRQPAYLERVAALVARYGS